MLLVLFMSFTGVIAQKITEIKTRDLPTPIEKYIKDKMPGASIFKAVKLNDKGTLTYDVAIDLNGHKHVYVFDKNGKFLKKGDELVTTVKKTSVKYETQQTDTPRQISPAKEVNNGIQNNPKK